MSDDPRIVELRSMGASIAEQVYFGPDVYIERDFAPLLTIEAGAVLSQGTTILLHDSSLNNVAGAPLEFSRVTLRERSYLGANVTVLCGVEVGAGALVGACSLVTGDIPAGTVAIGQPARVISTVEEVVARHEERGRTDPRWISIPATPWRERTPEDLAELDRDLLAALKRSDSEVAARRGFPGS